VDDYPVKVRIDYPEASSRGWAVLTIFWIKALALIPHFIVLAILYIVMTIAYFIAQIAVVARGQYPPGLFNFVTGVIRWGTRVSAFFFSLTDRYPPFSLESDPDYPVDIDVERPEQSNRVLAGLVLAFIVIGIAVAIALAHRMPRSWESSGWQWINLRALLVLPHSIIVGILGIAVFVVWVIVQWVILFVARYPEGMHTFVSQWTGWYVRIEAYTYGLTDRYPPFRLETMERGTAAPAAGALAPPPPPLPPPPGADTAGPAAAPPPPPPPASGDTWTDDRFPAPPVGEERTTELPLPPAEEAPAQPPAPPAADQQGVPQPPAAEQEAPPQPPGGQGTEPSPGGPGAGPSQPPTPPPAPPAQPVS
jgi:hypothetical protein